MSEEILVQKITKKHGTNAKGTWTRTAIQDGNGEWLSTFDTQMIPDNAEGKRARINSESKMVNGRVVRNLLSFELVDSSVPDTYSHQRPDGEADWDKVALGKTRCALWMNFLCGHLAANLYAKAVAENSKAETKQDPVDYVIITGVRVVVAAERDIFERPPGDDGIPFLAPDDGDIAI